MEFKINIDKLIEHLHDNEFNYRFTYESDRGSILHEYVNIYMEDGVALLKRNMETRWTHLNLESENEVRKEKDRRRLADLLEEDIRKGYNFEFSAYEDIVEEL